MARPGTALLRQSWRQRGTVAQHGRRIATAWAAALLLLLSLSGTGVVCGQDGGFQTTSGSTGGGAAAGGGGQALQEPKTGEIFGIGPEYNGCAVVRDFPDVNRGKALGALPNGTVVEIAELVSGWYRITSPKAGYVYSTLIKVTGTAPAQRDEPVSLGTALYHAQPSKTQAGIETNKRSQFQPPPTTAVTVPAHLPGTTAQPEPVTIVAEERGPGPASGSGSGLGSERSATGGPAADPGRGSGTGR